MATKKYKLTERQRKFIAFMPKGWTSGAVNVDELFGFMNQTIVEIEYFKELKDGIPLGYGSSGSLRNDISDRICDHATTLLYLLLELVERFDYSEPKSLTRAECFEEMKALGEVDKEVGACGIGAYLLDFKDYLDKIKHHTEVGRKIPAGFKSTQAMVNDVTKYINGLVTEMGGLVVMLADEVYE